MPASTSYSPSDVLVSEVPSQYVPPRARPRRSYGYNELRYIEQATMRPRTLVTVERDFARDAVRCSVVQADGNGNLLVPERIEWRAVQAGEEANVPPMYLDERAVETLAQQLMPLSMAGREAREMERRYEETRTELRSVANQLQETRDRNDDLNDQVAFLRRTVRWLEQELRDANRERRGIAPRPEPTPSAFTG
jgi:hypothetical protein